MFFDTVITICLISVCFGVEDQIQESSVQHPLSYISLEAESYEKDKPVEEEENLKNTHHEGQLQLNNTLKDDPKKKEIERKTFQLNYNEDINTGQNTKNNNNDKDQLVSLLIYHKDKSPQKHAETPHQVLNHENKILSQEINYKDFLTKYTDDTDFNDAYLKYLLQKQKIQKEANIQVQIYHEQKVKDNKHHHKDEDKNKHKDDYHHHEKEEDHKKHEHHKIYKNEHTHHPDYEEKLKYELKHYPKLNDNRDAGKYRIYYGNAINTFDGPRKHQQEESQTEGVEYLQHLKENADKAVHYITKHYYDHLQKHQNKRYGGIEIDTHLPQRHYPDYYENSDVVNKQYVDYQIRHETGKSNSQEHPNQEQKNVNTANPLKFSVEDANLSGPSEIKNVDQYNSLSEDNEFQDVYDMEDDDNFGYGQYGIDLKKVLEEATINDQKLEHDFNRDTNEVFDVNDTEETNFKENTIGDAGEEKDLIAEEFGLSQETKIDPDQFLVNGHANVPNLANATTSGDVRSKRKSAEATSREIKRNSFKKIEEGVTENPRKYRGRKRTFPKETDKLEVVNLNNTKGDKVVRNRKYGKKYNSEEIFRINDEKKEIESIFTTQPTRNRQRGQTRSFSTRFQDIPEPTLNSVIPKQEDRYSRINTRRPPNTQQKQNTNKDSRESSETKEERKQQPKKPTNQRGRIRYTHVLTGIPTITTTTTTTTTKPSRPIKIAETSPSNVLVEHYFEAQTYRPAEGIINPYSGFTIPQYETIETTEINFLKEPDDVVKNT